MPQERDTNSVRTPLTLKLEVPRQEPQAMEEPQHPHTGHLRRAMGRLLPAMGHQLQDMERQQHQATECPQPKIQMPSASSSAR
jgi:hypothetical protein